MGLLLHKKKDKGLYNVYSTVIEDYLYEWSNKEVITTYIYNRFLRDARERTINFMQEVDEEV